MGWWWKETCPLWSRLWEGPRPLKCRGSSQAGEGAVTGPLAGVSHWLLMWQGVCALLQVSSGPQACPARPLDHCESSGRGHEAGGAALTSSGCGEQTGFQ